MFLLQEENVKPSHNWKTCPEREADHNRRTIEQAVNFIGQSDSESISTYEIECSDSYSVPPIVISAIIEDRSTQGPADSGLHSVEKRMNRIDEEFVIMKLTMTVV